MIERLSGHATALVDACIWIYHLEAHPRYTLLTRALLRAIAGGAHQAIVSELTLLELQVQPMRVGRPDIATEYELVLSTFPNVLLRPIDRPVLHRAAALRARYRLRTPDAIIIATGLESGATAAVTNDNGWRKVDGLSVVCVGDAAAGY